MLKKKKEGKDICCNLANSLPLSAFLWGSACHGEQHAPADVRPKSSRCQRLCHTFASALWSHPRGTPQATRATPPRPPSQKCLSSAGLPAAHAALKSVPLDAVKTIRGATSPHFNPGCVIILHRHGRPATAKLGSRAGRVLADLLRRRCSPPLLQLDFHREKDKGQSLFGRQRNPRAVRLSTQLARTRRAPRGFSPWHSGDRLTERRLY